MRAVLLLISFAFIDAVPPLASGPWGGRNPKAPEEAVVISGRARFTVLTDRLLRLEVARAEDASRFEDRATMFAINRDLGTVPPFTQTVNEDGVLVITTAALQLTYNDTGNGFTPDSLSVVGVPGSGSAFEEWHYGKLDVGNLLGTIRTLDQERLPPLNCTVLYANTGNQCGWDASDCACEWAPISKDGWAVIDDSQNYALSDDTDFWDGPNTDAVDCYLFAHGRDYPAALADFVAVGGKVALTPRSALGPWWTRWYDFTQGGALESVLDFKTRGLPLDALVLDMNWHTKDGWTGYSFDRRLIPFPRDLFEELHDLGGSDGSGNAGVGLVALNLHDADGVGQFEQEFAPLCEALGLDSAATTTVPYNVSDERAQNALEDVVLLPLEDAGVDFFWVDWQQGESGYGAEGGKMNPTIWTAHQRCTDHARRHNNAAAAAAAAAASGATPSSSSKVSSGTGDSDDDGQGGGGALVKRGMVLARWGGLGGHRYQVGFSGDVKGADWATLSYQPYFSATAANVGFGYWSHDVVGAGGAGDPELYVRWVQWGAYSGVLRMHDRGASAGPCADDPEGGSCMLDKPWEDGVGREAFTHLRAAIRERSRLLPYLYSALRTAHDTGVSALHPLYYEWPEEPLAYLQSLSLPEYALGPDLVVCPVLRPASNVTRLATVPLWVPPGKWVEQATGRLRSSLKPPSSSWGRRGESKTCAASSVAGAALECGPPLDQAGCEAKGCCWDPNADNGQGDDDGGVDPGGGDLDGEYAPKCFYPKEVVASLDTKVADLSEVPVLVRAGAVVPSLPSSELDANPIGLGARPLTNLALRIYLAGATQGGARVYEDDGVSTAYAQSPPSPPSSSFSSFSSASAGTGARARGDAGAGRATREEVSEAFTWTPVSWEYGSNGNGNALNSTQVVQVTVGAPQGLAGFLGSLTERSYEVRLVNSPPATAVNLVTALPVEADTVEKGAPARSVPIPSLYNLRQRRRRRDRGRHLGHSLTEASGEETVGVGSWHYEAKTATLVVTLTAQPTSSAFNLSVSLACPPLPAASAPAATAAAAEGAKQRSPLLKIALHRRGGGGVVRGGAAAARGGAGGVPAGGGGCGVDNLLSGLPGLLWRSLAAKEVLNEARACPGEATGQTTQGALQELAALTDVLTHHARRVGSDPSSDDDDGGEDGSGGGSGGDAASKDFWDAVKAAPAMADAAQAELAGVNATALGASAWRLARATALLAEAVNDLE